MSIVAAAAAAASARVRVQVGGGLADDITIFAAPPPLGNDANNGLSAGAPKTIQGAAAIVDPGDVVGLMGGTYTLSSQLTLTRGGTASEWVVYKPYGDGEVIFNYTGASTGHMIFIGGNDLWNGPNFIEWRGCTFNGNNVGRSAFRPQEVHHIRLIGNRISNGGTAGIVSNRCDYVSYIGNLITHCGYQLPSWSSGISHHQRHFLDTADGFHDFLIGNIISGCVDVSTNLSDGNGIILDLTDGLSSSSPCLVANNVCFQNGGRGLHPLGQFGPWFVNNTSYGNELDSGRDAASRSEIAVRNCTDCRVVNNIAQSWVAAGTRATYRDTTSTGSIYENNMAFGESNSGTFSPDVPINDDPEFLNPMALAADGEETALEPWNLGTRLHLSATSPARGAARDPRTMSGLTQLMIDQMTEHLSTDVSGNSRNLGGSFDLGAYET